MGIDGLKVGPFGMSDKEPKTKKRRNRLGLQALSFIGLFSIVGVQIHSPLESATSFRIVPVIVPKPSKPNGTDAHTPAENPFEFVILVVEGFGKLAGCWDSKSGGVHPREGSSPSSGTIIGGQVTTTVS